MKNVNQLREFESKLRQINQKAGFSEVSVPQMGLSSVYEKGIKDYNMIKFMDGPDVYALRSDFTTGIVHDLVKENRAYKNLKVSYFGEVFRKQFRKNESYQAGIEVFYDDCIDSDLSVLRHAGKFISALAVDNYIICIGLAPFIESLRDKLGLDEARFKKLIGIMQEHNHVALKEILASNLLPHEFTEIWEMLTVRDNQRVLNLLERHFPEVYKQSNIAEIIDELDDHFILDLSLAKSLDYYTGIIFDAYIADYSFSVLYGGRYDKLAQKFGGDFAAVGFAMNLDYVLENYYG